MNTNKISDKRKFKGNKIRPLLIFLLAVTVAVSLIIYAFSADNLGYSISLVVIAAILVFFFGFFALRRYNDAEKGLPFEDERSRRVMEKAASKVFYVSLYLLLAIGWLSEDIIKFRDISQATGIAIGIMALIFFAFWLYYNKREI